MRHVIPFVLLTAATVMVAPPAHSHCQIPCGIYDDELRVQLIEEHITTIEKSMLQIQALGKATPVNYNQLVRWIDNKEHHAQEIQDIVAEYFLAQRIKTPDTHEGEAWDAYVTRLSLLHHIIVTAMKAKQSTDISHIETLRKAVQSFRVAYFGEEGGHSH